MEPWQERVIGELTELNDKIHKLMNFMTMAEFNRLPDESRQMLTLQLSAMNLYGHILHERTKLFPK
jgi:hypothetical protein